jgi:NADH:quinone reductase (non-electrogenic)
MPPTSRVVIVGGGFAGVKCARVLRSRLPRARSEIVLFNHENHTVFHPLLAEVAGASLNPDAVAAPLRQMLPSVNCRTEDVQSVDLEGRSVEYEGHDGQLRRMAYDHVVIACGSAVNLGMVPGMADHAFPLKTVGDAMALRAHVMQQLEKAEVCDDRARRRWYLSFVVVGGGYSGVESAGEINDLARGSRRFFPNIAAEDISVTIIHSRDQILPEISSELREFARAEMEKAGIRVLLNARVALATPEGVGLRDGSMIRGATVVCTIGSTMSKVVERLAVAKSRGRLVTEPDMRLKGFADAWAVGDCAEIVNGHDGEPCPPTGQFAERQGRQAARNIVSALEGEPTRPFRFKPLGQLCSIGGRTAVAELFGARISGFVAWFLWRSVYLFKLQSWSRRIKVGFDWAWELVFSRDLAHLKTDQTERVSNAYYPPGDYVFREGEPGTNFYVVEKGEVEVVRATAAAAEEILAVLGPGDFFGEMALIDNRPRMAGVRARTPVEVVVMGRNVFSQISKSLAPLRELLAAAVRKRAASFWQRVPLAAEALASERLGVFLEPLPVAPLRPDSSFAEALSRFDERPLDFCCVVDGDERLVGILSRTDLLRAVEGGARRNTKVREFMVSDPIALTGEDSALLAASTMRDHDLRALPVVEDRASRRLTGYVRAEKMLQRLLDKLPADGPAAQPA